MGTFLCSSFIGYPRHTWGSQYSWRHTHSSLGAHSCALPSPLPLLVRASFTAPAAGVRKVDRARGKMLHADSILQRASLVPPVHWTAPRPKKVYAQGKGEGGSKAAPAATHLAVGKAGKKVRGVPRAPSWAVAHTTQYTLDLFTSHTGLHHDPRQCWHRERGQA